jgi:hypothetical protein
MAKNKYIPKVNYSTSSFTPNWPAVTEQSKYMQKPTGRYEVTHTVDNDSEFLKEYKRQYNLALEEAKKLEKWIEMYTPFKPHRAKNEKTGDWEEVPGKTDVNFKAKAVDKDGNPVKLNVVDKYGRAIRVPVWGGSEMEISYFPNAYYVSTKVSGIKFQMLAVKVNTLVTKGNNPNEGVSAFTFEDDTDAPAPVEPATQEEASREPDEPTGEDDDFNF